MSSQKKYYIDVVLPLKLWKNFTYEVSANEYNYLDIGMRVAVPFGKQKVQTGIVYKKHLNKPLHYETKPIFYIVDKEPIITNNQWRLFEFIASYYLTPLGLVVKAALPGSFMLEHETYLVLNDKLKDENIVLTDEEYLVKEALEIQKMISIKDLEKFLPKKKIIGIVNSLIEKGMIKTLQEIKEKYRPKTEIYIQINEDYLGKNLDDLLDNLAQKAPKQYRLLMNFFKIQRQGKPVLRKILLQESGISSSVLKGLVNKGILYEIKTNVDRINFEKASNKAFELSAVQKHSLDKIIQAFVQKKPVLLHGVTSSGKTEIYIHLIQKYLDKGQQVLYLVPEIALTTQLVQRLVKIFGNKIAVYHSKYSQQERREIWMQVKEGSSKAQIILGARSSVFLPFKDLGLIIVDEEHEVSYKQIQPAPRYNARDMAIVLARFFNADILLGSATPSIESYYNTQRKKYQLIELNQRFANVKLPYIEVVDLKMAKKKKQMEGNFSRQVITEIDTTLKQKKQVIVFQNRRGYAPVGQCEDCGHVLECPHCDVSLTLHKYQNKLKCHYCGYSIEKPVICPACGNPSIKYSGFGTEQIQADLIKLFPQHTIDRLDSDTTRGKNSFKNILTRFQNFETDILVGTQMLVKGLDFEHVGLVVVMNADQLLFFPDFRADERSFQMLMQVAGRAGRKKEQGKVLIQTFNPSHPVLQMVLNADYQKMYQTEIQLRKQYFYPPFSRMINFKIKDRNLQKVIDASEWLKKSFDNHFEMVLGPSDALIPRIQNKYIKEILIKLKPSYNLNQHKMRILHILNSFENIAFFKSVKIIIDVDPY